MDLPAWAVTLVGSVAAICTTAAFVPQVIRVWRLRRADEISLVTFLVFAFGTLVWLVFGLLIGSLPIILANGVTLVLAWMIVILKLSYERTPRATPS